MKISCKRILFAAVIGVISCCTFMTACSNNSSTAPAVSGSNTSSAASVSADPAIVGTWKNEDVSERMFFTFTFNADLTGRKLSTPNTEHSAYYEGFTSGDDTFTYEFTKEHTIYLHFPGGGYQKFDYIASADSLQLSEPYKNDYKTYQKVAAN